MNDEIKILVVDDTKSNLDILNSLLNDKYDVLSSLDGEFAIEIANEDLPDLILLDVVMPNMDGFEVCKKLKLNSKTQDIPIMFITSISDENSIEKAYELGCVDFISKPFKPRELLAKVNREIQLQKLIKDLEESKEELKILASTDPLTGLYNRRHFTHLAEPLINLSKRSSTNISVIMLDIDKFKSINDKHGHKAGDLVIQHISNTLTQMTRCSDLVCRFGGEEFLILLPDATIIDALKTAEKIKDIIQDSVLTIKDTIDISVTFSAGISLVNNNDSNPLESAIINADNALYRAKEGGRNMICLD